MIIVDTNVVSETMRLRPALEVLAWLDAQPSADLWITSVVAAELMTGAARLPEGARKRQLTQAVMDMLETDFSERILPFDVSAAVVYADIVARRERMGQPIAMGDAQIAAVCLAHGAALATRNVKDFVHLELTLHNPWEIV